MNEEQRERFLKYKKLLTTARKLKKHYEDVSLAGQHYGVVFDNNKETGWVGAGCYGNLNAVELSRPNARAVFLVDLSWKNWRNSVDIVKKTYRNVDLALTDDDCAKYLRWWTRDSFCAGPMVKKNVNDIINSDSAVIYDCEHYSAVQIITQAMGIRYLKDAPDIIACWNFFNKIVKDGDLAIVLAHCFMEMETGLFCQREYYVAHAWWQPWYGVPEIECILKHDLSPHNVPMATRTKYGVLNHLFSKATTRDHYSSMIRKLKFPEGTIGVLKNSFGKPAIETAKQHRYRPEDMKELIQPFLEMNKIRA